MADVPDEVLAELERLLAAVDPAPWTSSVEGRDHSAGDHVVLVGETWMDLADLYMTRDGGQDVTAYQDLLALARNHLPAILAELRRRRRDGLDP